MALVISWTDESDLRYANIVTYLEINWTDTETYSLESRLVKALALISENPYVYAISVLNTRIRKANIDVNNFLLYRVDEDKEDIKILTFCSTRQQPLH